MKRYLKLVFSVFALSSSLSFANEVGFYENSFIPTHRDEAVNYFIWYPAEKDGELTVYGDSPIIYGKQARKNASPIAGKHSLVILSHGGGGNAGQLGWLTEALVKHNYVVVGLNHPKSTTGDFSAKGILSLWNRPQDISQLLDLLMTKNPIPDSISFDNISALGFSAGGYSVLNLAGARPNTDKLKSYCKAPKGQLNQNFCRFLFKIGGKDIFAQMDWRPATHNYHDKRINKTIAIDPGVVDALDFNSLNTQNATLLINLGTSDIEAAIDARPVHKAIANSTYVQIADANHFSFLGICKPHAKAILAEEADADPLCDLPKGAKRSREQVHQALTDKIVSFLSK